MPRLLDLFCCEGGAAKGYADAGFDVVGVDLERQPRYPFAFRQDDALALLDRMLAGHVVDFGSGGVLGLADFDVIHASPPCQAYSITRHSHDVVHPQLIEPVRDRLVASGLPYVIENVVGAPLRDPLRLCGSEFGLTAIDTDGTPLRLERHRLFESNVWFVGAGGCAHDKRVQVAGAYGGGSADLAHAKNVRRGGYTPGKAVRSDLLGGVGWMTLHGQAQCVPPVYTRFIGEQIMATLPSRRVLALLAMGGE